ncbi:hypothetical protein O7634_13570 [Micromonospora sp. WMMD1120]|uniref:hypothetical protein n=1 Tax=Micromonospora sp. WMMD1120 TaxID=3016106 RepID=UPI002417C46F|nr:hypothetical protein [Micromonospora sp. WMMD1120]MDG4807779.1 hypothetical protein [Micromonospora sp. WMMD1120]
MTGRPAARDQDDRPTGPAIDDDPGPDVAAPRVTGVAPQPRPVPGDDPSDQRPTPAGRSATPARPTPVAPTPTPARPTPTAPVPSPTRPGTSSPPAGTATAGVEPTGAAVEVEPTTGAPVDAVPRRVPVRQQKRRPEPHRPDGDPQDDDGVVFWAPIEQVHWDGTPVRTETAPRRERRFRLPWRGARSRPTPPPDPLPGLAALVGLTLATAFFAWVSAGPFWLAVGHARAGAVVLDDCTSDGLTQRCRGTFLADDGRFVAHGVRVTGVPAGADVAGTSLPAGMIGADSGTAYADVGVSRHLRWLPGLLVVLGCTAGIVRCTGSARLPGRRHRRWAVVAAVSGPVLITVGFLIAAW